ncbi:hypothetical protein BZG36_05527, partial [Bifiguratus adelaidae]
MEADLLRQIGQLAGAINRKKAESQNTRGRGSAAFRGRGGATWVRNKSLVSSTANKGDADGSTAKPATAASPTGVSTASTTPLSYPSQHKKLVNHGPTTANGSTTVSTTTIPPPRLQATRITIGDVTFIRRPGGNKLVREGISEKLPTGKKPSPSKTPKTLSVDGVDYVRTRSGNLVRKDMITEYLAKRRAKKAKIRSAEQQAQRSKQGNLVLHNPLKRKASEKRDRKQRAKRNKAGNMVLNLSRKPSSGPRAKRGRNLTLKPKKQVYCRYFDFTGTCKNGSSCRYIHDKSHRIMCRKFLQKACPNTAETCPLNHYPTPHIMPHCLKFQRGFYHDPDCLFAHVKVNEDAPICRDFVYDGYCPRGIECTNRHLWVCPNFWETGTCKKPKCRLPHIRKGVKGKTTHSQASNHRPSPSTPQDTPTVTLTPAEQAKQDEESGFVRFDFEDDDGENTQDKGHSISHQHSEETLLMPPEMDPEEARQEEEDEEEEDGDEEGDDYAETTSEEGEEEEEEESDSSSESDDMYDFVEYCLRKYYKATGWNFDNQYVNLCASSRALLDFTIPRGMSLTMSRLPTPLFKPTYQINALPTLHGSLGYIFSSRPLDVGESAHVDIGEVVDWLRVVAPKTSPQNLEETSKDYMIYGRLFLPGGRLHALYTKRLSKHDQLVVTVVSDPVSYASSYVTTQLQHDVGKWCTECSYTTDDGLIGFRALYNIGPSQETSSSSPVPDRLHATSEEFVAGNPLEVINAAPDMSVNVQQTQLDELLEPAPKLENKFDTQDASVDPFNPSNDDKDTMPYDVYNGQWSVGAEIYYGTMDRKAG